MAWYKVADAPTLEQLQDNVPAKYQSIPIGKRTQIVLDTTPFPVAPLFDLAGAEFAAKLLQHGGKLIDVSGRGAFQIVFEIEAVDTASAGQDSGDASMAALPAVVLWIGVIAGILVLLPIILRLATLLANFIPSSGGDDTGGGIMEYLKTLFGDYTPYVLIGGAVILFLLLKPGKGGSAPIIYNISGKKAERESED